jgi:hypothetical protein
MIFLIARWQPRRNRSGGARSIEWAARMVKEPAIAFHIRLIGVRRPAAFLVARDRRLLFGGPRSSSKRVRRILAREFKGGRAERARFPPARGRVLRRRARLGLAHVAAQIVAHARGMKPQPRSLPTAERNGAQNTRMLIDPPTSPARHTRDLARIDQSLRRCAASTEVGHKTLNYTIGDKVSDPVDELRLNERVLEPLALVAYACIAPSRLLRAPDHTRTIPDG